MAIMESETPDGLKFKKPAIRREDRMVAGTDLLFIPINMVIKPSPTDANPKNTIKLHVQGLSLINKHVQLHHFCDWHRR